MRTWYVDFPSREGHFPGPVGKIPIQSGEIRGRSDGRQDAWLEALFGGLSMACNFADLVQSGNYSVVTLPAQPGTARSLRFQRTSGVLVLQAA